MNPVLYDHIWNDRTKFHVVVLTLVQCVSNQVDAVPGRGEYYGHEHEQLQRKIYQPT